MSPTIIVLRRRLAAQRLTGARLASATDAVRLLTCVQSQECGHAFWSLGMRSAANTAAEVQAEFDGGRFVRTHILRPTWHLVAAEDLRWILGLTSGRVQQINQTQYRQLELTQPILDRATGVIIELLRGGRHLTRAELGRGLAGEGIAAERQRLAYVIMNAELEGVICSGPMRGAAQTYALLDERVPGPMVNGDLAELARRFFVGHGPASLADLARWASLTVAQAEAAADEVGPDLAVLELDGVPHWFDPDAGPAERESGALLLPLYDEVTLSYPKINFPLTPDHPHPPGTDLYVGCVIVAGANVGLWRRTVKGQRVMVELSLAPTMTASQRVAIESAAGELARFLGKRLELTVGHSPAPGRGR